MTEPMIRYHGFSRTEALENFVFEHLLKPIQHWTGFTNVKVTLEKEHSRRHLDDQCYTVKLMAHGRRPKSLFVEKRGKNVYEAIAFAGHTLGQILTKSRGQWRQEAARAA